MGGVEEDAWGYLKVNNLLKKRRKKTLIFIPLR